MPVIHTQDCRDAGISPSAEVPAPSFSPGRHRPPRAHRGPCRPPRRPGAAATGRARREAAGGTVTPGNALAPADRAADEPEQHRREDQEPGDEELNAESDGHLSELFRDALRRLAEAGHLVPGADPDLEADRLHALFDGLCRHAVTAPERMPPERIREIVRRHLETLVRG